MSSDNTHEEMENWTGVCSRPDCSRTKPPVAYGKRWGECFTHEMLGVYFQYEMAGEPDGWNGLDASDLDEKFEVWLKRLEADGVDIDAFAEKFAHS